MAINTKTHSKVLHFTHINEELVDKVSKILVIRGGAIGDFLLTLPAIRLLREAFPAASIEILGKRHILQLIEGRYYTQKIQSIDAVPLARFFSENLELDATWCSYFAEFKQIISYVMDPDKIFAKNLRRAGVSHLIQGSCQIQPGLHAASQLAKPLESLGLFLKNPAAHLFPLEIDRKACSHLLNKKGIGDGAPFFTIHPGSGGQHKNWPIHYWVKFCLWIFQNYPNYYLVCVGGEADTEVIKYLSSQLSSPRLVFFENLPLSTLAVLLAKAHAFVGHDTGVSHIAAAAGAQCLLLYGPTDPHVWAPTNERVHVLTSPTSIMEDLAIKTVCQAFESLKSL